MYERDRRGEADVKKLGWPRAGVVGFGVGTGLDPRTGHVFEAVEMDEAAREGMRGVLKGKGINETWPINR